MEREPLGPALHAVMTAMIEVARMVRSPYEYDEVVAEKVALHDIALMANLILNMIKEAEKGQLGVLRKIRHHS
jgi:hypothetical protein